MVRNVTDVKVLTLYHDISTVTGEEVVLLTLAESPDFRVAKGVGRSTRIFATGVLRHAIEPPLVPAQYRRGDQ